ncbi:class I SAM-dependent methyltransferase [candidate division KSB1 bacterium]
MRKFIQSIPVYFICIAVIAVIITSFGQAEAQRSRDRWQQPEKVMDVIGVKQGMVIGEAGAGDGYFTFKLAERVGDKGKIYANEIDRRGLKSITRHCEREGITNIETVLGKVDDPLFPSDSLDMVFMAQVFHHLDKPVEFLQNIKPYLKSGAFLVMVENEPAKSNNSARHYMPKDKLLKKVSETDFELDRIETFLSRDNIYIFRLKK